MQIHASNAVVVGCIAALLAPEQVEAFIPVALFDVSALGTSLAGVGRIHLDYFAAGPGCLILELLAQVVESPADTDIAVLGAYPLCGRADAGQVFQHKLGCSQRRRLGGASNPGSTPDRSGVL